MFDPAFAWTDGPLTATEERVLAVVAEVLPGRARLLRRDPDGRLIELRRPEDVPGAADLRRLLAAGAEQLAVARAAQAEQSRQAGVQARALAAFATARPAAVLDRPDGEVGAAAAAARAARPGALTAVSEWAVDEVMVALGLSSRAASQLLADSVTLAERLPGTLAALEAGVIGWPHARVMVEVVAPVREDARDDVERRLLAGAAGQPVGALRAAARRAVLRADAAAAAARLTRAIRDRGVRMFPGEDGMGSLQAVMTLPVARACRRALEAYAADCHTPGDERTTEQRMVDCLADLILRPGLNPPVQIGLTVVAGVDTLTGGDEPGEIDGHPVPAVLVRELAHTLGLLPRPEGPQAEPEAEPRPDADAGSAADADAALDATPEPEPEPDAVAGAAAAQPDAQAAPPEDQPAAAPTPAEPTVGRDSDAAAAGPGGGEAAVRLADLLGIRTLAGTGLSRIPEIAIVEELTGQLLALTDATAIRHTATCGRRPCRTGRRPCSHPSRGPGLGAPPDTPGYRPSAPLDRFVRARDRRCRFPGCRAAAIRCDLDHTRPWPAGPTGAANLCCLCRHHHRLSHQAPGWTMTRLPDGALRWTTPGGHTHTTHPPRYDTDDDLPPPAAHQPARARPLGILEQLRRWPPPPPHPDDEPAPF